MIEIDCLKIKWSGETNFCKTLGEATEVGKTFPKISLTINRRTYNMDLNDGGLHGTIRRKSRTTTD